MTAEAKKPDEGPTLAGLARDALAAHDGSAHAAVDRLVDRLLRDRVLLRAVIAQVVRSAAGSQTQHAVRSERRDIIQRATSQRSNVLALARGLSASLLDMPLAGGIRLRSCTRSQVQQEADRFDNLSRDCGRKARFLASIAQSIPDGRTVGDWIDDARAIELWGEAS